VKSNSTLRWSSIRSGSQLDIRAAYVGRGKSAQEFSGCRLLVAPQEAHAHEIVAHFQGKSRDQPGGDQDCL
jgi:hypothetical protein